MAPRANWKGYLRLSLVSCPIALYPASSLSETRRFISNITALPTSRVRWVSLAGGCQLGTAVSFRPEHIPTEA